MPLVITGDLNSLLALDGEGDGTAQRVAAAMYFFDGTNFRLVRGESVGGVPNSGPQGWITGAWQKNPLLLGYSAPINISLSDTTLAAGTNTLESGAVPAGEIWVLTHVTTFYVGTPPTILELALRLAATNYMLKRTAAVVTNESIDRQGQFVLTEGGSLRVAVFGATLNDDLYLQASGYRIDIDQ